VLAREGIGEVAAVNQECFDELARGLATKRLSRRQVPQTFAASSVLSPLANKAGMRAHVTQDNTGSVVPLRKSPSRGIAWG